MIRFWRAPRAGPPTPSGWVLSTPGSDRRSRPSHPARRFSRRSPGHPFLADTQGGVIVGQPALFDLCFGGRRHDGEPLMPQHLRGLHVGRVGDRLVPRPSRHGPGCGGLPRSGAPSSRCCLTGHSDPAAAVACAPSRWRAAPAATTASPPYPRRSGLPACNLMIVSDECCQAAATPEAEC
jgi:hypothetical protein